MSHASSKNAPAWWHAIRVERQEWPLLLSAAFAFMMVLAAYYVIRPVRDQLAAAVGSTELWKFWAAAAVVMLFLTPAFGWLVSRFRRSWFVPLTYGFFIALLLLFVPLFHMQNEVGAAQLGTVFYVFVSVFSLFVVSLFWSVAADVFSIEQAKRLFPVVAFGGTVGALIGPIITRKLVNMLGVPMLLVVSAVMLGVATILIVGMGRLQTHSAKQSVQNKPMGGDVWAGLKQVIHTDFLRYMALAFVCLDGIGTVVYALMADYVGEHYTNPEARTAFYAQLDLWTNLLQITLQLGVTRFLLLRFGAGRTLFGVGILNMVLFLLVSVMGPMLLVALQVSTRGIGYGVGKPAGDSLYARAPRDMRYKGKNVIDTLVWRVSDLFIAGLWTGAKAMGIGLPVIAVVCAGSAGLSGWLSWRASRAKELMPEGDGVDKRVISEK